MAGADNTLTTKKCSKCGETKPHSEFRKDKSKSSGYASNCAECKRSTDALWRSINRDKNNAKAADWYSKNRLERKEYNAKKYALDPSRYKTSGRIYRAANREKLNAAHAVYYAENKNKMRESGARWGKSNTEKTKVIRAAWNKANPDKKKASSIDWRARNPGKSASAKAWARSNPERVRIYGQNRRARKKASSGCLSQGLSERLFHLQKGKCACCGRPLGTNYHMDHVMPLALGGDNIDSNVQLLRQQCNRQKWAKHPIDFMQERGFLL